MNDILKQSVIHLRQQPLLSGLTIAGTALSICLIMIVMMTREVQLVDYSVEPHRSRTLYATRSIVKNRYGGMQTGMLQKQEARDIFARLKTPESVAFYSAYLSQLQAGLPAGDFISVWARNVSAGFFHVFDLRFVEGRPFTDEECLSSQSLALLSRTVARRIFGQERDVVGRTFILANHEFTVTGVVEDVSPTFKSAYAEVWVPVSPLSEVKHPLASSDLNPSHNLGVAMLAKGRADFPKIRSEVEQMVVLYNQTFTPDTFLLTKQPDEQEAFVNRKWSNVAPDIQAVHWRYIAMFSLLLIVPAINIASMMQSRLRQRRMEIGVRRAFGARRSTILWQTVMESLVLTLAAGLLGLLLCFVVCHWAASYIFEINRGVMGVAVTFDAGILFSPQIYGWALFFCLVLNLMSSLIPAWRASRVNIVEALK